MTKKTLFIASTGQDVGKTTLSLGLFETLRTLFPKIGYMKPVGQEQVAISTNTFVDKDALLLKEYFQLPTDPTLMSPVLIPPGFTKDFLDEKVSTRTLEKRILKAYQALQKDSDLLLIEGTGHLGVGSILNLNNVQVAKMLNAKILLIAEGGLGSSFDALSLNLSLCHEHNVAVEGVILNKVIASKKEQTLHYMQKALNRYSLPILGCIPYTEILSALTLHDLEMLFKTNLISGFKKNLEHFEGLRIVATSTLALKELLTQSQILIIPASRDDILTNLCHEYATLSNPVHLGLVLTGETPPSAVVLNLLQETDIPALHVAKPTQMVVKSIHNYHGKIQKEDILKIQEAIRSVSAGINLEKLLEKIQKND